MKPRNLKIIPILLLPLLFAGCSSMPGFSGDEDGVPAPITGPGGSDGGAQTAGASPGGPWSGNPLDNPDSPLYTRVIYFDYDIDQIHPDYHDVVIAHGAYLAANPALTVTIEGHADERGSREYNIGLGERRAMSVKRLMLAQGAAESQIVTISYGEERPAMMDSNESSWAQNRRAVFVY
jgi:peptidoglycan-associated lipoprotein